METIFRRTEKKYILSEASYKVLMDALKPVISLDEFGKYTVRNIYWDTDDYALIRHSLSGPAFKEKLRERKYENYPYTFMELKTKFDGVVYKRRMLSAQKDGQIRKEIDHLIEDKGLVPKIVIVYDREAYTGKEDRALRITFDHRIRFQTAHLDCKPHREERLLFDENMIVMEIKTESAIPLWLGRMLSEHRIFPCSCSKYGMIYTKYLEKEDLCLQASSPLRSRSRNSACV